MSAILASSGLISPLLANIGLHGLETVIKAIPYRYPNGIKHRTGIRIIRYADDFIVTGYSREYIHEAKKVIENWLLTRNLVLSEEKTKVVHVADGFDLLGFTIRTFKGKAIIRPAKEKVFKFCKRIGEEIRKLKGNTQEVVIAKLNPIRERIR